MPRVGCTLLLLMLAACNTDPMDRPGTWHGTTKSNDANLRAMIADPHDLIAGKSSDSSLGAEAAPAVTRLLTGKRYPLPSENTSDLQSATQSAPPPPPPQ
jgi:hypothetical protein